MITSQLLHEARIWLESEDLDDRLPDPYGPLDIPPLFDLFYPGGWLRFVVDIQPRSAASRVAYMRRWRHEPLHSHY